MNVGLLTLALTVGQPIEPAVPPPALPPAPFLFVTVNLPEGGKVTWFPTLRDEAVSAGPVGLRPGYPYRFMVSEVDRRGSKLYPTIELRGALVPRAELRDVSRHPVPIMFSGDDISRAVDGHMITKVYYLEDPEKAAAVTGRAGEALEFPAESEEQAIDDARHRGRPMLIVRLGERPATREELAAQNVPGTILFPGAKVIPFPPVPPLLPFNGIPIFDPIIGAKGASEECIKDGGDVGPRAAPGPGPGGIGGLDPTDTVMRYTTPRGDRTAVSNRVCICVPRFGAMRVEAGPVGHQQVAKPEILIQSNAPTRVAVRQKPEEVESREQPRATVGGQRASATESRTGVAVLEIGTHAAGLSSVKGVAEVAQVQGPNEITAFPGCKTLLIQKWIDPPNPERIGQEITVHLKFMNPTNDDMTDVVVADSLSTRLEYVPGTAQTSRPATFVATPNSAKSLVLRWSIDGKLMPGESGTITFKVRIK
jgi:uncharacterized repeat protein (TIGR01451 family)